MTEHRLITLAVLYRIRPSRLVAPNIRRQGHMPNPSHPLVKIPYRRKSQRPLPKLSNT